MAAQWYLYKDGMQQGPMSWEQLRERAQSGGIEAGDHVWTEGMSGWTRADDVVGLLATAPSVAPAPPPSRPVAPQPQAAATGAGWAAGSTAGAYPKAPMGRRFLAYFIDGLISSIPISVIGIVMPIALGVTADSYGDPPVLVMVLAFGGGLLAFLWAMGYTLLRDGMGQGQSPGKKMFKLMVVRLEDGEPCTKGNSLVRNLIAGVLSFIDIIVALFQQQGQRVGDMLAKTQVIEVSAWGRRAY